MRFEAFALAWGILAAATAYGIDRQGVIDLYEKADPAGPRLAREACFRRQKEVCGIYLDNAEPRQASYWQNYRRHERAEGDWPLLPPPVPALELIEADQASAGIASHPAPVKDWEKTKARLAPFRDRLLAMLRPETRSRMLGLCPVRGLGSSGISYSLFSPSSETTSGYVVFIEEALLDRSIAQWATEKERTVFSSATDLRVDFGPDGGEPAVGYLLAHELGHAVGELEGLLPPNWVEPTPDLAKKFEFTRTWTARAKAWQPIPPFPMRPQVDFYKTGKITPRRAPALYRELSATGFPTLYSTLTPFEDFAESFALYWRTVIERRQAGRVVQGGHELFAWSLREARRAFLSRRFPTPK